MTTSNSPHVTGTPLNYAEAALPGVAIGLVAGLFATGVGALAGLPATLTITVAAALGIPLALLGGGYCVLLARGVFHIGAVGPMAIYWIIGFPLARLFDEYAVAQVLGHDTVLREPLLSFLALQAMLSIGFAIGFLWLHERIAPHWLLRISGHNVVAAALIERYLEHVSTIDRRRKAIRREKTPSAPS